MAWLESHQALRDHPKKDRLAELLFNGTTANDVADMAAVGLLHHLWWWALDYAQDGDLTKFSDRQIAKGCGWTGDGTLLVESLIAAGFIDRKPRRIHDWYEYAGKLIERRAWNAERMRQTRAAHVRDTCEATDLPTFKKRARDPVDKSTNRDARAGDPVCWRCHKAITGDDMLDGKIVDSRKGIRHKDCVAP